MKKFLFFILFLIVVLFTACDSESSYDVLPYVSGTWKIKSLIVNGVDYLYNDHVGVYAPDIAKSVVVFGDNNTFKLSFVYKYSDGEGESYEEVHSGTFKLSTDGKTIDFIAKECTKGGSNIEECKFSGEFDGDLLRISKSFSIGELRIIPIEDKSVAVNVIFKLTE